MDINDIRRRMEKMDQNMLAALSNGGIVKTSRGMFNITDEARMASWFEMRNNYAGFLDQPEAVVRDYMAVIQKGLDYTDIASVAKERINTSLKPTGMDSYTPLTTHQKPVYRNSQWRRVGNGNGYRMS